jgi:hypothetical protein
MGQRRRPGARATRALVAALAALVLFVGVLRANARYFYCPWMGAIASHACCAPAHDASDEPAVEAPDCCEIHRVGALPAAAGAPPIEVATAPLVATLPASVVAPLGPPAVRAVHRDPRHRGPPRPGAARARTMVFLI